jgi:hypothetical protein
LHLANWSAVRCFSTILVTCKYNFFYTHACTTSRASQNFQTKHYLHIDKHVKAIILSRISRTSVNFFLLTPTVNLLQNRKPSKIC